MLPRALRTPSSIAAYTIDYHGFIGDMLKRTAGDVDAEKALYKDAEFFTFCSAVVSRKVMEADIGDIAYCPYVVLSTRRKKPGAVTVGFRMLPRVASAMRSIRIAERHHLRCRRRLLRLEAALSPRFLPAGIFFRPIMAMLFGIVSSLTASLPIQRAVLSLRGGESFGQRQGRRVTGIRLRLPICLSAQLTAFLTKLRGSVARRSISGSRR
jgi:hypothetical protein